MTDDKREELLFQINGKLAAIDSKLDSLSETIMRHESRITALEQNQHNPKEEDFKVEMLKLLSKGVVVGLVIIASLTGSAGIISKIFM